jgi:hypothetical protein
MNNANEKESEERALEALIVVSFYTGQDDSESYDDPRILSEEDCRAMAGLGDDLVDRIVGGDCASKTSKKKASIPSKSVRPEVAALNRGDDKVTELAKEEMERKRKKLRNRSRPSDPKGRNRVFAFVTRTTL